MKVGVNLTWLMPGRVGGSEEYLVRQLTGIDETGPDIELLCHPALLDTHPVLAERFHTIVMPVSGDRRSIRIALEHSWLAYHTRRAAVVHHGGGTAPIFGTTPFVLTVHDLQYRRFPHYFGPGRRRYLTAMVPRSVRRAAVVAVPSEFVRREVIEAFDVADERVVVVPHGVPDLRRPTDGEIAAVRARFAVADRPYVVFPAITHPHKGHVVLVDALGHLDDAFAIVLIGGSGTAEPELARAIAASPSRDRVVRPGRVAERDRDALVAGAEALVFPSEFEGFGAPVIEAMALETPVVCSDAPALVEVVGDAAVVVRSRSGEAWAAGIDEARAARTELVERGRRRRRQFTVAESGRAIEAAYRQASP